MFQPTEVTLLSVLLTEMNEEAWQSQNDEDG